MSATLNLPVLLRAQLESWAASGYPLECCGLLLGHRAGTRCDVLEVRPARNLNTERAHDRYELAPDDYFAIDREARELQLEIVGVWHTHPDHPAHPSETDRAAAWPEMSYLILAVGRGGVEAITSWRLAGQDFEREEIEA